MGTKRRAVAWFYRSAGQECGPFYAEYIEEKVWLGETGLDTLVRREGDEFSQASRFVLQGSVAAVAGPSGRGTAAVLRRPRAQI